MLEKLEENVNAEGKHQTMLESACCLLSYLGDILTALKHSMPDSAAASPPPGSYDLDLGTTATTSDLVAGAVGGESDWADDVAGDEDDSTAEDSVS